MTRPPEEIRQPRPNAGSLPSKLEILLIVLLAAVPYLPVLGGPFLYDDTLYVVENHQVTNTAYTLQSLTTSYPPGSNSQALYRPLVTLSYALDHALAGLNPAVFHLSNLLLHVGASLAAYALLRAWFPSVAGWAAMLFAVHPVHTEAVAWIVGRAEILCGLFLFLALRWSASRGVLAAVALLLALLSKEMAISAPLLLLLPVAFLGVPFVRSRTAFVAFALVLLLYLVIRRSVLGWMTPQGDQQLLTDTGLIERLPSLFVAYAQYLRLSVLPTGLAVDHAWESVPTWQSPAAMIGVLLVAGLGSVAWILRRRQPWVPVAIAWFLLALLPVSHLFPIGATYAERFLYTPVLGACLAIAALLQRVRLRYVGAGAFVLLVLAGGAATFHRSRDWTDAERFYQASIAASPRNATLKNNLGRIYADRRQLDLAEKHFEEALELKPDHAPALCNLGVIRAMAGRLPEAQDLMERSIRANPGYARGYCNLGKVHALGGRTEEARAAFERTLELNPDYAEARAELLRLRQGQQ